MMKTLLLEEGSYLFPQEGYLFVLALKELVFEFQHLREVVGACPVFHSFAGCLFEVYVVVDGPVEVTAELLYGGQRRVHVRLLAIVAVDGGVRLVAEEICSDLATADPFHVFFESVFSPHEVFFVVNLINTIAKIKAISNENMFLYPLIALLLMPIIFHITGKK